MFGPLDLALRFFQRKGAIMNPQANLLGFCRCAVATRSRRGRAAFPRQFLSALVELLTRQRFDPTRLIPLVATVPVGRVSDPHNVDSFAAFSAFGTRQREDLRSVPSTSAENPIC
jgi:hypothetical protein